MSQTNVDVMLQRLMFPESPEQLRLWTRYAGEWAEGELAKEREAQDARLFEVQMALEGAYMMLSALDLAAEPEVT